MNKTKLILAISSLFVATALSAQAQYRTETAPRYDAFSAQAGEWEFTLGGGGSSDKDLDNSSGTVNASLGFYLTDTWEIAVRQSAGYSDVPGNDNDWNGATFAALDYHFGTANLRPFVGVNFGGYYGDSVDETFAAGVEGGVKLYVREKTFIFALVNYNWLFDEGDEVDNNFDDGRFDWTVGIGFNF